MRNRLYKWAFVLLTLPTVACSTKYIRDESPKNPDEILKNLSTLAKHKDDHLIKYNGQFVMRTRYDLDGDMKADASELRKIKLILGPLVYFEENPFLYWYDSNGNNIVEAEEIRIDEKRDGFDGSEKYLIPRWTI